MVAYFLLTGKHLFEASTVLEICSKHMLEAPMPPSQRLGKDLPAGLEAIVLGCLAKDRDARPASAAVLRTAFLTCADAARYDLLAARACWQARRTSQNNNASPVDPIDESDSRPAMMAIDLGDRSSVALSTFS